MSHRRDRLSHVVREVVSDAIANRLSDPRVNRLTSVIRVELSADLRIADVLISVMGTESQARTTLRGLSSARGAIQTRLARQLNIRHCPIIRFRLDPGIKRAIETYREIAALDIEPAGAPADSRETGAGEADSATPPEAGSASDSEVGA